MGMGDFVKDVGGAVKNVTKAATWAANPTHYDDIAHGVGAAGSFALEHPGQVAHIAGEVGKGILKDQLDPKNLVINAGLIAATALTGGAAAPALLARAGLGVKAIEAGVAAGEAAEVGSAAVKGIKAVDTATDVARSVKTGAKAIDTVTDVAKAADTAGDVAKTVSRGEKFSNFVLGSGEQSTLGKVVNPMEKTISAMRDKAASQVLKTASGEAPGLLRQAAAAGIQGVGRQAPTRLAGMSDNVYQAQKAAHVAGRVAARSHQLETGAKAVHTAANPVGAVKDAALNSDAGREAINDRYQDSGYSDRGQTAESMYPGQKAIGPGQAQSPYSDGGGSGGTPPPGGGPPPAGGFSSPDPSDPRSGGSSQVGTPTSTSSTATPSSGNQTSTSTSNPTGAPMRVGSRTSSRGSIKTPANQTEENAMAVMGGGRGQHFWEGSRSHPYGGISSNYDWRPVEPLRPINVRSKETLNAQGAPESSTPEVDDEGMHAISTGQQPMGSVYPGSQPDRGSHMYADVKPGSFGAIDSGAKGIGSGSNVLDVDSSSPDDIGFDKKGQGFFDFGAMGSSTKDVGLQPGVGSGITPMNALTQPGAPVTGSRTQRRGGLGKPLTPIINSYKPGATDKGYWES